MRLVVGFLALAMLSGCIGGQQGGGDSPSGAAPVEAAVTSSTSVPSVAPALNASVGGRYIDEGMSFTCPLGWHVSEGYRLVTEPESAMAGCVRDDDQTVFASLIWIAGDYDPADRMGRLDEAHALRSNLSEGVLSLTVPQLSEYNGKPLLSQDGFLKYSANGTDYEVHWQDIVFNCNGRHFILSFSAPTSRYGEVSSDIDSIKMSFRCGSA